MASDKPVDAVEAETGVVPKLQTRSPLDDTLEATSDYSPSKELAGALTARQRAIAALGAAGLKSFSADAFIIDSEVDRGGMGRVLLAADQRLGRAVALKQLLPGGGTRQARFIREMLITARLQHPNIVPIYEAGRWEGHGLVYSMRKIDGQSLRERLQRAIDLEGRLALLPNLVAACDAIAYAHSEGIIHRDIKPANMILGDYGETIIIDWGLAKAIDEEQAISIITGSNEPPVSANEALVGSDLTAFGSVVGTPRYMSPEQAAGEIVGTAADVYSLGACLYELLTGEPPYAEQRSAMVLDAVVTSEPRPPGEVAANLPAELIAICRLAMEREPEDRYSARELADELRRYQAGALVGAHKYTAAELLVRWLRRNRMAVAVGIVAAVALVTLAIASATRLVAEKRRTQAALEESLERNDELLIAEAKRLADTDPLAAIERLTSLSPDSQQWQSARAIAAVAARRGIPDAIARLPAQATRLEAVGGVLLAIGAKTAWRIDPATGVMTELALPEASRVERAGRVIGFDGDQAVSLDLVTGARTRLGQLPARPLVWATSKGERFIAWGDATRGIVVRDRETGAEMRVDPRMPRSMAFSPTSQLLAAIVVQPETGAHIAVLVEPNKPALTPLPDQAPGEDVATSWSPDGEIVYLRFASGLVIGYHPGRGALSMSRSPALVAPIASHRGGFFAIATQDRRVIVHRQGAHRSRLEVRGLVHNMKFAPAGESIAIAGAEGQLYNWSYASSAAHLYPHRRPVLDVAFNAAGDTLYSLATDRWVRRFRVARRESKALEPLHPVRATAAIGVRRTAVLDGGHVIGIDGDSIIHYDTRGGDRRPIGALPADVRELRISGSGEWVAIASVSANTQQLRLWSPARSGEAPGVYPVESPVTAMSFGARGNELVTGHADGSIWRWSPGGVRVRVDAGEHSTPIAAIASSGLGPIAIATAESDLISIIEKGRDARELRGHAGAINGIGFSADGQRLASIADDLDLRLWDLADGTSRRLGSHTTIPTLVTFSPDSRSIASIAGEDTFLWDVATGLGQAVVSVPYDVTAVRFSADGRELFMSNGYVLFSTRDDVPHDTDELRRWIADRVAANPEKAP